MDPQDEQPERNRTWQRATHAVLVLYWVAIFTLTHVPRLPPPPDVPQADKLAHLCAYGLLAVLYFTARSTVRPLVVSDYVKGCVIFALYGLADELLQIPVGRSCEGLDWVADVIGAFAGTGLFWLVARLRRRAS